MSSLSGKVSDLPGVGRDPRLSELLEMGLLATAGVEFANASVVRLKRSASTFFPSLHHELGSLTGSAVNGDQLRGLSDPDSPHVKSLAKEVRTMAKAKKAKKAKTAKTIKKSPKKGK